jgi:subtilisin family serine protease
VTSTRRFGVLRPRTSRCARCLFVAAWVALTSGCGERILGPVAPPADVLSWELPSVPEQLVAQVATGWSVDQINAVFGTETIAILPGSPFALLHIPYGETYDTIAVELLATGACITCEPNYVIASPEAQEGSIAFYEGNLTKDDVADQEAMARVRARVGSLVRGGGITVAILDTGIDASHPDLAAEVRSDGWDFVDMDADPTDAPDGLDQDQDGLTDEAAGHGTHVAGVVHFIAPKASLLPVRVLDSEGNGTVFGLAQGVHHATTAGAHVINMSLALDGHSTVVEWTIEEAWAAGTLSVSSAGNQGVETDSHFPASLPEVIGVAAVDADDLKATFSNYGPVVSMSAPGVGVVSHYLYHGYAIWSGTSMACPFVSATAALVYKALPGSGPADVQERVEAGSASMDHKGQPYDGLMGEGRVDVFGAVVPDSEA